MLYTLIFFLIFLKHLNFFFSRLSHYHELHGCSRVTRCESFRPCSGGGNGSAPETRLAFFGYYVLGCSFRAVDAVLLALGERLVSRTL